MHDFPFDTTGGGVQRYRFQHCMQAQRSKGALVTDRILFGAAYYPEYTPDRPVIRDLDLMQAAGMNLIRVGESVWSTWEPRDGEFDLDWLAGDAG